MVLCPTHHDRATKGAMPEEEQRRLKSDPFNIRNGFAKGKLAVRQSYPAVALGSVIVVNDGPVLCVDDDMILGVTVVEGDLAMSIKLYSSSDQPLLEIENNEWLTGDPLAWDIEADWQKLTVRERHGTISLRLDGTRIPTQIEGKFYKQGLMFEATPSKLIWHGGGSFSGFALAGIHLNFQTKNRALAVIPNGLGQLISESTSREMLHKAREWWLSRNRA